MHTWSNLLPSSVLYQNSSSFTQNIKLPKRINLTPCAWLSGHIFYTISQKSKNLNSDLVQFPSRKKHIKLILNWNYCFLHEWNHIKVNFHLQKNNSWIHNFKNYYKFHNCCSLEINFSSALLILNTATLENLKICKKRQIYCSRGTVCRLTSTL